MANESIASYRPLTAFEERQKLARQYPRFTLIERTAQALGFDLVVRIDEFALYDDGLHKERTSSEDLEGIETWLRQSAIDLVRAEAISALYGFPTSATFYSNKTTALMAFWD